MERLDEYLEKRGVKYLTGLVILFYATGAIVFNVYLRSLGIYEFEVLQLRYMFMGITFFIVTALAYGLGYLIGRFVFWALPFDDDWTKKQKERIRKRIEIICLLLLIPWTAVYAFFIFPVIAPGFGGGQPTLARLIGKAENIKNINDIIAHETGIDPATLPFEMLSESSDLALGSNVKILDRNEGRIFLLLTKELYLSSRSSVAKKLLEQNSKTEINTEETRNFLAKPLIVNAGDVEGITLTLYEPPEILTNEDLKIAAAAIAADEDTAQIVSDVITEKAPETGTRVFAAVQKSIQQTTPSTPTTPAENPSQGTETPAITKPTQAEQTTKQAQEIEKAFEEIFDSVFLEFRSRVFSRAVNLAAQEKLKGKISSARLDLVSDITDTFKKEYPEAWATLDTSDDSYLIIGQKSDENFPQKIVDIFRGAENAETLVSRINAQEYAPDTTSSFPEVRDGAIEIIEQSFQEDTAVNRKYMSQLLLRHFGGKARQYSVYWEIPKYLSTGREDIGFISKVKTALQTSTTWESFRDALLELQVQFEESQKSEDHLPEEEDQATQTEETTPDAGETETPPDTTIPDGTEEPTEPLAEGDPPVTDVTEEEQPDGTSSGTDTGTDTSGTGEEIPPAEEPAADTVNPDAATEEETTPSSDTQG